VGRRRLSRRHRRRRRRVGDEAALRAAFADGTETSIALSASISLTDCVAGPVTRSSSTPLQVDGGGFTVTQTCGDAADLWQQGTGALNVTDLSIVGGTVGVLSDGGPIDLARVSISGVHTFNTDAFGVRAVSATTGAVSLEDSDVRDIGAGCCTVPGATGDVYGVAAGTTLSVRTSSVEDLGSGIPGRATGLFASGAVDVDGSSVARVTNGGFGPSAGIRSSAGAVTVTDSEVSAIGGIGAPLGGILADGGHATVVRSRVHDVVLNNGGVATGVGASEGVSLTDSSVFAISAQQASSNPPGGVTLGVYSSGPAPLSLTRSTVANVTPGFAGTAGGVFTAGDVEATDSTITGNIGPGVTATGTVRLMFSDVVDNGGTPLATAPLGNGPTGPGQLVAGHLDTFASVIAKPRAGFVNCIAGEVTSGGANFADDQSCILSGPGDRQEATDPQLGPLADNGGPTATLLPAPTSPLVRAVDAEGCERAAREGVTTDQRGLPRLSAQGCDIGSVELQSVPLVVPPRFTG
jgi:hypothetical protein